MKKEKNEIKKMVEKRSKLIKKYLDYMSFGEHALDCGDTKEANRFFSQAQKASDAENDLSKKIDELEWEKYYKELMKTDS